MAKELPYFKFEPAEYLTKNISFCSLSAQGLFSNICCYYWQRGCSITKDQILRRLNYPNELQELISEGIIDLNGENISIKFLDKQLELAIEIRFKNSQNGSKGGRPKKQEESEKKPTALFSESETKAIREDKIKEEEKKENNIKEEKIQESPFGDGRLHFICKDYSNKNTDKYPKEFYIEFLQYWTAPIQKGPKKGVELWRDEKTFQIASRLSTSWNTIWKNRPQEKQIQQTPKIVASTQHYEKPLEPTEEEKIAFRKENGLI